MERWRSVILIAVAAIGVLLLFANRPPTMGGVIGVVIGVAVVFAVVELVRRPAAPAGSRDGDAR